MAFSEEARLGIAMAMQQDRANKLQALLTCLQGVCVEVLDWADAQAEERRPEWVDRLASVMEERT